MKIYRRLALFGLVLALLFPAAASAHGTIFTYKYIDGDNLVMATHNVHDPQAGEDITYNLRLYTVEGQLTPFEQVKAQIRRGSKVIDRESVSATEYGDANFVYSYPKPGNYVITFTFLDHDKQIAHAEFPIVVGAGLKGGPVTVQTAIAFLLGAAATLLYVYRKSVLARVKKLRRRK